MTKSKQEKLKLNWQWRESRGQRRTRISRDILSSREKLKTLIKFGLLSFQFPINNSKLPVIAAFCLYTHRFPVRVGAISRVEGLIATAINTRTSSVHNQARVYLIRAFRASDYVRFLPDPAKFCCWLGSLFRLDLPLRIELLFDSFGWTIWMCWPGISGSRVAGNPIR